MALTKEVLPSRPAPGYELEHMRRQRRERELVKLAVVVVVIGAVCSELFRFLLGAFI